MYRVCPARLDEAIYRGLDDDVPEIVTSGVNFT